MSRYFIQSPAKLWTTHHVEGTDNWTGYRYMRDVEDSFLIVIMTHTNLSNALETAWTRAGFKFSESTGVSPDLIKRTSYKITYPDRVQYNTKGHEYAYKRKWSYKVITETKEKTVKYERNGKKIRYKRKIRVKKRIRYVQLYEDGRKKGPLQRARTIPKKDIDRANTMTENDEEAYYREKEGKEGFIARTR